MKKILLLAALAVSAISTYAQGTRVYSSANTDKRMDTLVNAGTTVFNLPQVNSGERLAIQLRTERIDGTTGYVAKVKGSIYGALAYDYILPTDTVAGSGTAAINKLWSLPLYYPSYQVEIVQTGTQRNKAQVYYYIKK